MSVGFKNKTRCLLCPSRLQEALGKSVVLICLVFGCNYQPRGISRPLPLSSDIVSLLCFAFLICFFLFPFLSFDSSGLKKNRPDCLA